MAERSESHAANLIFNGIILTKKWDTDVAFNTGRKNGTFISSDGAGSGNGFEWSCLLRCGMFVVRRAAQRLWLETHGELDGPPG